MSCNSQLPTNKYACFCKTTMYKLKYDYDELITRQPTIAYELKYDFDELIKKQPTIAYGHHWKFLLQKKKNNLLVTPSCFALLLSITKEKRLSTRIFLRFPNKDLKKEEENPRCIHMNPHHHAFLLSLLIIETLFKVQVLSSPLYTHSPSPTRLHNHPPTHPKKNLL